MSGSTSVVVIPILVVVVMLVIMIPLFVYMGKHAEEQRRIREELTKEWGEFVRGSADIYLDQFYDLRQLTLKTYTSQQASQYECEGVFVIYCRDNRMFYIGESNKVFNSINLQLKGRGNKDLFEDIEAGEVFLIKAFAYRYFSDSDKDDLKDRITNEFLSKGFKQYGRKTVSVFEKVNYNLSMKLFADSRVKYIDFSDYVKITDSFSIEEDYYERAYYYLNSSFCIIAKLKTVSINYGMDEEDRFDHFIVALRDGKSEYQVIEKRLTKLKKQIEKNPDDKKTKKELNKYQKIIKQIPDYIPYSKADSADCFNDSLIRVNYESQASFAKDYVVLDVETNGLSKKLDDLLSISIYDPLKKVCYNRFLPLDMQPSVATGWINGIADIDLLNKKHLNQDEVNKIINYFDLKNRTVLVFGSNDFDSGFINAYLNRHGLIGFEDLKYDNIKKHIPSGAFDLAGSATKDNLCKLFGIEGVQDVHSGQNDCLLEWKLFEKFVEYRPIRIKNKFYKFNEDYIVPITVLIQNPEIYKYSEIPFRYVLGTTESVFSYNIPEKALNKIKKFDTNITGISLENIIYAELGVKKQDNAAFLIKNKMQLQTICEVETKVEEIPVQVGDDGLIEAIEEKDKSFISEVNNVALVIKDELKTTIKFIKEKVFANEDILSQELVLSEENKVLALCDLSSVSSVMEIKTFQPSVNNLGYLDNKITYQLFYQAKKRQAYYLYIFIGGDYERPDKTVSPRFCNVSIYKVHLDEYTKEEYEEHINQPTMDEKPILEYLKNNPNAKYKDLSQAFSGRFSEGMIRTRIKDLEKKKLIVRIGSTTNYHWEVK